MFQDVAAVYEVGAVIGNEIQSLDISTVIEVFLRHDIDMAEAR